MDPSGENESSIETSHRVLGKDLTLILFSNFFGSFGDGLYAYLLPVYMTKNLGASSAEIGILYAAVNLTAALTLLFSGIIGDRYDPKKVMIVGWVIWVPVPIIFALATNWPETILGMALWGSWLGGPSMTVFVARAARRDRLTLAFTAVSAGWSLGYIFSPALGGYLSATIGMRLVFFAASALYALAGATLFFIGSQQRTGPPCADREEDYSVLQLLRNRKVLKLSILFASVMFALMLFRPFIPRFLLDVYGLGEIRIGVLGSMLFFGSSVIGIMLGRVGDRWQKSYALASGLALCSLSLALLLTFSEFYVLTVAVFMAGCSYALWGLMNAIITSLGPESARAGWVSIPQATSMLISTFAPYIGGVLYDSSPRYPFILAIVAMLVLALSAATGIFERTSPG